MKHNDSRKKRLFLFAGFNKSARVDDALIYYIRALNKFGDVILVMDSDCPKSETNKIKKHTKYTNNIIYPPFVSEVFFQCGISGTRSPFRVDPGDREPKPKARRYADRQRFA